MVEVDPDEFVERVYWCTSCGMCEHTCHVEIPFPELWEEVKEWLVDLGVAPLPAHKSFLSRIEKVKNPFDEPESTRGDWADDFKLSDDPEVIYYVGCTESFRMQKIAKTTATVLQQSNVPFNIMGDEEWFERVWQPIMSRPPEGILDFLTPKILTRAANVGRQAIDDAVDQLKKDLKSGAKDLALPTGAIVAAIAGLYVLVGLSLIKR